MKSSKKFAHSYYMAVPASLLYFCVGIAVLAVVSAGVTFWWAYRHHAEVAASVVALSEEVVAQQQALAQAQHMVTPAVESCSPEGVSNGDQWMSVQQSIEDGVVQIFAQVARFDWLRPYKAPEEVISGGSGFFINERGDILTNYHVVAQARVIKVRLPRVGQEQFTATIVGVCPDRDIALLQFSDAVREKIVQKMGSITFLTLGDSDTVVRTQEVMALGFPLGRMSLKSTIGNVSGWEHLGNQSFVQLTSPINPGSSGGPAVNKQGAVIGINAAGIPDAQNTGFFIPVTEVKQSLRDLYHTRLLRKPILGGDFSIYLDNVRQYLGNPEGGGWYITHVYADTLFAHAGIEKGDVLYELNGYALDEYGEVEVSWATDSKVSVLDLLNRYGVGDTLELVVYRKGERKVFNVTLDDKFVLPIRKMYPDFEPMTYEICGGMVVMPLSLNLVQILVNNDNSLASTLARYIRPDQQYEQALVITHLFPDSPAKEAKIVDVGLVLDTVNGMPVRTLDEFRHAVVSCRFQKFMTMTTQYDRRFVVLSYDDMRKKEAGLAALHGYASTAVMRDI